MDWDAPAIVLDARPYGEGDAIATVMTSEHGAHRGLARGGGARGRRRSGSPATSCRCAGSRGWPSNWAASVRNWCIPGPHSPWTMRLLWRCCRRPAPWPKGALPEREPHPRVFDGLLHLIAHLPQGEAMLSRPDPLGDGAARRSRLRARSCELRRHRRDVRPRLRFAQDRARGHRGGRRRLGGATAASAAVPGRAATKPRQRTGATGCG